MPAPSICCIEDLRALARKRVPRMFYDYVDGGSWTEHTYRANEEDFRRIEFRQRVAVDIARRSTAATMAGQAVSMPVAIALDTLALPVAHVAGIAERRVYHMLSGFDPDAGLPPFLSPVPGLHSGYMIAQYTAAACCNEIIGLCTPASVANLSTSAGMEDYNSWGPRSAAKAALSCTSKARRRTRFARWSHSRSMVRLRPGTLRIENPSGPLPPEGRAVGPYPPPQREGTGSLPFQQAHLRRVHRSSFRPPSSQNASASTSKASSRAHRSRSTPRCSGIRSHRSLR